MYVCKIWRYYLYNWEVSLAPFSNCIRLQQSVANMCFVLCCVCKKIKDIIFIYLSSTISHSDWQFVHTAARHKGQTKTKFHFFFIVKIFKLRSDDIVRGRERGRRERGAGDDPISSTFHKTSYNNMSKTNTYENDNLYVCVCVCECVYTYDKYAVSRIKSRLENALEGAQLRNAF